MAGFDNDQVFGETLALTKTSSGQWQFFNDGTDAFGIYNNAGSPEGVVAADIGSICCDTTTGDIYKKTTDTVATGWVELAAGAGMSVQSIALDGGTSPIIPNGVGLVTFNGATAVAGTSPVSTSGTAATAMALTVQISQALAAADATKIGLSNFDSSTFGVDADGFVTLTASGASTWVDVTGTSDSLEANTGYIANNAGLVTLTLPATCTVGDIHRVAGLGAGGWAVAQNASQTIHFGSSDTTTGVGGSLASTNRYDSIELLCVATDTDWVVLSSIGNITIV